MTTTSALNRAGAVITRHGFIFATSIAMFVHSTWTFNTLFAGKQPDLDGSLAAWVPYLLWVTPGALIAAAIDIGQVQTSSKLMRAEGWTRRAALSITFIVLAIAGYYLQWFHLIHHMPDLQFGAGLSTETQSSIRAIRDAAIFIIPALLPISTILYTMSEIGEHSESEKVHQVQQTATPSETHNLVEIKPVIPTQAAEENEELSELLPENTDGSNIARCEACGWEREYDNPDSARRGLATHLSRHCPAMHPEYAGMNGNGVHHEE